MLVSTEVAFGYIQYSYSILNSRKAVGNVLKLYTLTYFKVREGR